MKERGSKGVFIYCILLNVYFQDLIDRYLYPLEKNKADEERVSNDLIELRNQVILLSCFRKFLITLL